MLIMEDSEAFIDWGNIDQLLKSGDEEKIKKWHDARHYHVQECTFRPELHHPTKVGNKIICSCGFAGEL